MTLRIAWGGKTLRLWRRSRAYTVSLSRVDGKQDTRPPNPDEYLHYASLFKGLMTVYFKYVSKKSDVKCVRSGC